MGRASWNLLGHTSDNLLSALSTSTLYVSVFSIIVPILVFVISLIRSIGQRNTGVTRAAIFKRALRDTLIGAGITISAWVVLFTIFAVRTIYFDHHDLVSANAALKARLQTKPSNQYAASLENSFALINTVGAFAILNNPLSQREGQKPCQLKVTSPVENISIGRRLSSMAAVVGCRVIHPGNPDSSPEVAGEVVNGAVQDYIVVHAAKEYPKAESFQTALSNSFSVRRAYTLPPNSPSNLVWLQIGPGSIWRKN